MIDTWCATPDKAPHVCALTRNGEEANGPYFETRLDYLEPFMDEGQIRANPTLNTLYLSAQAIREACDIEGSPFVVLRKEVYALALELADEATAERDKLKEQLAEAYADIEVLTKHIAPVVVHEPMEPLPESTQIEKRGPGRPRKVVK